MTADHSATSIDFHDLDRQSRAAYSSIDFVRIYFTLKYF